MTKINRFHSLGMTLIAILTILDIVTRGIPITWSNFTVINIGMIFSIICAVSWALAVKITSRDEAK